MSPSSIRIRSLGIRALVSRLATFVVLAAGLACAETPMYADWHVWVDEQWGIALDLPPTHAVGSTEGAWYVHGWIDGDPMVPDMSVRFRPGIDPDEAIRQGFARDAVVEHVHLGRGVPARRVTGRYETRDGTPYVESGYVVPATEGVFVIRRWESFDWQWFEHVALTFRFVKTPEAVEDGDSVPPQDPEARDSAGS